MNVIEQSPDTFRQARLKGGRPEVAMVWGSKNLGLAYKKPISSSLVEEHSTAQHSRRALTKEHSDEPSGNRRTDLWQA
jgi:hypothetical protein